MNKYDDIIDLPHHTSLKHPKMSIENRASQFAPFAALTGHKEAILETERITEDKIYIDESKKEEINNILLSIENKKDINICVKYFVKDKYKSGGKYIEKKGILKRIDKVNKYIIFKDNYKINILDIISITMI